MNGNIENTQLPSTDFIAKKDFLPFIAEGDKLVLNQRVEIIKLGGESVWDHRTEFECGPKFKSIIISELINKDKPEHGCLLYQLGRNKKHLKDYLR